MASGLTFSPAEGAQLVSIASALRLGAQLHPHVMAAAKILIAADGTLKTSQLLKSESKNNTQSASDQNGMTVAVVTLSTDITLQARIYQ